MTAVNTIKQLVADAFSSLYSKTVEPTIDYPTNTEFGDFTTNIAMQFAKEIGKTPRDIANEVKTHIESQTDNKAGQIISGISVAGPGFLNFTIVPEYYWQELQNVTETFGSISTNDPKRIIVEYGQPNTHKLPHIGHIFSYVAGDSIARILEKNGNTIKKANYRSDIGPNVAQSIYSWIQKGRPVPETLEDKIRLLQLCYQEGNKLAKENPEVKAAITEINKQIYRKDPAIMEDYLTTRQWCLDFYKEFEAHLDIHQEREYLESEVWEKGEQIIKQHIGDVFEKGEGGAIIFKGEKVGLHTRVFLTQRDTPTYEAKDLGLAVLKYEEWPYDLAIVTTASEQNEYFKVIIEAIAQAKPELRGKIKHIGFGMVSLSTGKMSSRTGNILSGVDLVNEVTRRVSEIVNQREDFTNEEKNDITHKISLAAVKFTFLRNNIMQNTKFDIEESLSIEGKSGPYIQYTYARIQSVLSQRGDTNQEPVSDIYSYQATKEELAVMKYILRFPEIVKTAGEALAPHIIADYIYNLAQLFNSFYNTNRINDADAPEKITGRRLLTEKVGFVLKAGLELLGIQTVNKM
jgi:arginyl-tRNA synthetase